MEIYNPKKEVKKSWALRLVNYIEARKISVLNTSNVCKINFLCAVDISTGEIICPLITFYSDGEIECAPKAVDFLKQAGYNPVEYENYWNEDGSLHFVEK